jgi:hypothetical protein
MAAHSGPIPPVDPHYRPWRKMYPGSGSPLRGCAPWLGCRRPSGQKPAAAAAWTRPCIARTPLCHQVPSLHWGLELRDGRHQRSGVLPGQGKLLPGTVRVLSGAGACPSRAVAITSPPFLPSRMVQGRSSPPGLAPVRPEALVWAAGLGQQSGNWTESVTWAARVSWGRVT